MTDMPAPLSSDQVEQLVAPIALYPDALVAQILAGATYPVQVVEAARWQKANPGLRGDRLAAAIDGMDWDPSIKALTQFPSVLADMDRNLAWTSALGQAYYYQPQDVLNAVQVMRQRALAAGTLVNTPQQRVIERERVIVIQPANPNLVYVPAYNPTGVYGAPVALYPGYSTGELIATGVLAFGVGVAVGVLASQAWGWNYWNTDWHRHHVIYQNNIYVSRTSDFYYPGRYRVRTREVRPPQMAVPGAHRPPPARAPQRTAEAGRRLAQPPQVPQRATRPPAGRTSSRAASPAQARPGQPPEARSSAPGTVARRPGIASAPEPTTRRPAPSRPAARATRPSSVSSETASARSFRGFGKAPPSSANRNAFTGIAPGGRALAASTRGRTSLSRAQTPARAQRPAQSRSETRPSAPATRHGAASGRKR